MTSTLTCIRCRQPFEASRSDARYCSPACRQFVHRARKTKRNIISGTSARKRVTYVMFAKMFGMSVRSAGMLVSVKKYRPDLTQKMTAGSLTLHAAYRLAMEHRIAMLAHPGEGGQP